MPPYEYECVSEDVTFAIPAEVDFPNMDTNTESIQEQQQDHQDQFMSGTFDLHECLMTILFRKKQIRLQSFQNWNVPFVKPEDLAAAGFYYIGQGDSVKCAFCSVGLNGWEVGDVPLNEHNRNSPQCPFVYAIRNNDVCNLENNSPQDEIPSTGRVGLSKSAHPEYATSEARLKTFESWPFEESLSCNNLCSAGFFYSSTKKETRCFHCNIKIGDWQKDDDPWREHAFWSPTCGYVIKTKGQSFVEETVIMKLKQLKEMNSDIPQLQNIKRMIQLLS